MVGKEGLEKARAYLNQVSRDQQLNVPFDGHEGNTSPQLYFLGQGWVYPEEKKIPVASGARTWDLLVCSPAL